MAYWLLKSEPFKYSWSMLTQDKKTFWNGVRNYQAANYLKSMKKGDQAFFYHSNEGREIVGIVDIVKEHYPDPTDDKGKFVMVDVAPKEALKKPVSLEDIKKNKDLKNLALLRQPRLSVMPIDPKEWDVICAMAQGKRK